MKFILSNVKCYFYDGDKAYMDFLKSLGFKFIPAGKKYPNQFSVSESEIEINSLEDLMSLFKSLDNIDNDFRGLLLDNCVKGQNRIEIYDDYME